MGEENREKIKHRYIEEIIDTDATVIATALQKCYARTYCLILLCGVGLPSIPK